MESIITISTLIMLICTLYLFGRKWSKEYKEKQILKHNNKFKPLYKYSKNE